MVRGAQGTDTAVLAVVCPSCGEVYDTYEAVQRVLRNSGFCMNLTCLEDLTGEPLDALAEVRRRQAG